MHLKCRLRRGEPHGLCSFQETIKDSELIHLEKLRIARAKKDLKDQLIDLILYVRKQTQTKAVFFQCQIQQSQGQTEQGFPGGTGIKNPPANRHTRREFNPWVIGKTPWSRKWQLTPVFVPGKSHGQRSLVGSSAWVRKESDTTQQLTNKRVGIMYKVLGIRTLAWESGEDTVRIRAP